jgi:predicted DNA-binding protein
MDEVNTRTTKKLSLFPESFLLRLPAEMRESIKYISRSIGQTGNEFIREAIRLHIENCSRKEVSKHGKSKP